MTYDRIASLAYYIWLWEWGWRREGRWRHLIEKDRKSTEHARRYGRANDAPS